MEKEKIERINELSRIARTRELTDSEKEERAALRTEFIRDYRASLSGILDNSVIVRPDGTRERVSERKNPSDEESK